MSRFKVQILLVVVMTCGNTCKMQSSFQQAVQKAVDNQMVVYPQSTLKDLYKKFFQDRYGPGHLIPDTIVAGNYLRNELASIDKLFGAYYEPTGWEGCFYRVNLSVIKENLVPYHLFFDAFVRSANQITPISLDQWKNEWLSIDSIIQTMSLSLTDYEKDRQEIFRMLEQGEYVMHHSQQFETHYTPHYRIIEKTIFKKEILPFLR